MMYVFKSRYVLLFRELFHQILLQSVEQDDESTHLYLVRRPDRTVIFPSAIGIGLFHHDVDPAYRLSDFSNRIFSITKCHGKRIHLRAHTAGRCLVCVNFVALVKLYDAASEKSRSTGKTI